MDPITIGAIAAPLIGGALGNLFGAGDRAKAAELQQKALDEVLKLHPELLTANLSRYQNAGDYAPTLENIVSQGPTSLGGIQVSPEYKDAALQALASLKSIGNQGGMTLTEQSNLNKILNQTAAEEKGRRDAILNNFAARGKGGSGFELAAQLQAQQAGADRASQEGLDVQAQAMERALQAIQGAGNMGAGLNQQEFGQKAQVAGAQDAIDRFNAANRQDVYSRNTNRGNDASLRNLQNRQNLLNSNTDIGNQEQLQNNAYRTQYYGQQADRAGMAANSNRQMANSLMGNANATANTWGGIGQGVGQIGSALHQQNLFDQQQANADKRWQGYLDSMKKQPTTSANTPFMDYWRG